MLETVNVTFPFACSWLHKHLIHLFSNTTPNSVPHRIAVTTWLTLSLLSYLEFITTLLRILDQIYFKWIQLNYFETFGSILQNPLIFFPKALACHKPAMEITKLDWNKIRNILAFLIGKSHAFGESKYNSWLDSYSCK